ncbi:hypothetical protein Taro_038285, partial [Colocasia esculenta]|nr:hypothetical protein [Colocasia esculenta]
MNQLLSFSSSYPWSAMNEAGPSHNLNENLELHDAPVINDEVLENNESDGDDDNDNIQSSSDDDVNDDTNMSRPMTDSLHVVNECVSRDMTNWVDNVVANEYFIENEETEWMHTANVQVDNLNVDITFHTRELLITNLEASYLDVKKEILKLQEDTLNKLRIKIQEYEQPSIPSGAEYTPGESSGGPNTWAHPWTSEQWPN